ncbi:MAG: hypothetical protein CSA49_04125 [Gammaproteobacteria bacterium]|nr:MAG: hypothetical protein CSA49_04125 [Gammaproteobacteria bacterium]
MTTNYYLGFKASDELTVGAEEVLANRAAGSAQPYAPMMNELIKYFLPEFLDSFLIQTANAVGLSPRASKMVHGASDTIGKASILLVSKLLAKRNNDQLLGLVSYIDDVYLRADTCSNGANTVGCEISQEFYEQMKRLIASMKAGESQAVMPELHRVMMEIVDVIIEGFMKKAIRLVEINFVLRKICDASVATCRGAGHMVVNKVFKQLDDEQLARLADYFDQLIVTAER